METPPEDTLRLPASQPEAQPPAPSADAAEPTQVLPQVAPQPPAAQPYAAAGAALPTPYSTDAAPRPATTSAARRSLTKRQRLLAILGALLVVLVVFVSAGIIIAQPSGRQAKVATTPSATSQVPQATTTTAPATHPSVSLGSPLQSFTTTFGKPTATYADSATYVANVQQLQTRIFVALGPGKDGTPHGQDIHVQPDTGVWNLDTATAIMLQFLPTDAQHQSDVAGPNGVSYHVYHSNALAQIFPAATFTTTTRQTATAGSLSWFCAGDLSFCYIGPMVPASGG